MLSFKEAYKCNNNKQDNTITEDKKDLDNRFNQVKNDYLINYIININQSTFYISIGF